MASLNYLFGDDWYNIFKPLLDNGTLSKIAQEINRYRRLNVVIPPKDSYLFFRAFRETPYKKVKVVILGMDPYHSYEGDNPVFDGLAFSCGITHHPQPSLVNILAELEDSISDGLDLNISSKYDLTSWAKQGVLLVNTAHTVIKGQPGSHLGIWRPFTDFMIKALNKKDDIIWLLWGAKALKYKELMTNNTHEVVITSHPSPLSYYKPLQEYPAFKGSGCFNTVNELLDKKHKSKIIWYSK